MKNNLDALLDYEVIERPIYSLEGIQIDGYKQIVHSSTNQCLSVCKDSYTPINNAMFVEITEHLSASLGMEINGYASFDKGSKVISYLNAQGKELNGIKFSNYLVLGNSHDGSKAFSVGHVNYQHRCTNVFGKMQPYSRIYHTISSKSKIERFLKDAETLYYNAETGIYESMKKFEQYSVNERTKEMFVRYVLQIPEETAELTPRRKNQVLRLLNSIQDESRETGGTLLGLFNGATHYTTHHIHRPNVFGNIYNTANDINQRALYFGHTYAARFKPDTKVFISPRERMLE